jgi:hypothetical protein
MLKSSLVAMAFILATMPICSAKQEKQVTRVIWELSDFPDLEKNAKAICGSEKLVKSDKLKAACTSSVFPSVTKSGAFRNTGIGAELNTLIRQASSEAAAR